MLTRHTSGRILHLMIDSPYCAAAYQLFEAVAPGLNDVILTGRSCAHLAHASPRHISWYTLLGRAFVREINAYGLVVVHYMDEFRARCVARSASDAKILWMGWGGDYYPYLRGSLLEPATERERKLHMRKAWTHPTRWRSLLGFVAMYTARDFLRPSARRLYARVRWFAPVLPEDYQRAQREIGGDFPTYAEWSYGTMEDQFAPDTSLRVSGPHILAGHNATWENNHLEIFAALSGRLSVGTQVICPLSYGLAECRTAVSQAGTRTLGSSFEAVTTFVRPSEFQRMLASCAVAIFNHRRQQALGTILMALAVGARVYLNPLSPVFARLQALGMIVFPLNELATHGLDPISESDQAVNRKVLYGYWGRDAVLARSRRLVECVAPFAIAAQKEPP